MKNLSTPEQFATNPFARVFKLVILIVIICFGSAVFAGAKPIKKAGPGKKNNLALAPPTISYSGPQTYTVGTAITPVTPTSSGVAALGYGERTTTISSGFNFPHGVAVDAAGNIYVADMNNGLVKKILTGGEATIILGSGFTQPDGIALDAAGNVYVADLATGKVSEIPVSGGPVVTLGSGFQLPTSVAVDAQGNVFVAEASKDGEDTYYGDVQEIVAKTGVVQGVIGVAGGISGQGVALDNSGNIYMSAASDNTIAEENGTSVKHIGDGFNIPEGFAVDNGGNVYVADWGHGTVKFVPTSGGPIDILGTGFLGPNAIAVDSKGNLYVTDDQLNSLSEINPVGGYFISPALPAGLAFNSATGVISGTPTAPSPATTYTIIAYNGSGSSSATINIKVNTLLPTLSYTTPNAYLVGSAMKLLQPTTANVGAFASYSAYTVLATGLSQPSGVAVDNAGNVYIANTTANLVEKVPVGGGPLVPIGSGFQRPLDVAVDAAGNVYVADGALYEIPANGSPQITVDASASTSAVAIDAAGNIYYCKAYTLVKVPAGGGAPVTIYSGLAATCITFDGAGNLYLTSSGQYSPGYTTYKIRLSDGTITTVGATGRYIAVDGSGDIFTNSPGSYQPSESITEMLNNGKSYAVGPYFYSSVYGLAIDKKNNLFVTDYQSTLKEISPIGGYFLNAPLPAGMTFSSATGIISGTPTTVTPATNYSVTAYSIYGSTTATVNIKTMVNAGDNLKSLTVSKGKLSPVFAVGTTGYTDNAGLGNSSITVTPYALDAGATIKVNGSSVVSGTASGPIPLSFGPNTISVVVTASDGVTSNTYTITANRVSSNANLAALHPSTATTPVSPSFTPDVYNYSVGEGYVTTAITLTPKTSDANSTVTVNGQPVVSGTPSQSLPLQAGPNTITTVVTAQDGVTTQTYTFTVNRARSNNALLANLLPSAGSVIPGFNSNIFTYSSNVDNSVSAISITPTTADLNATVTVNGTSVASGMPSGPIALSTGNNTITMVVTAQDGITTKTYKLTVTRGLPDANLASLTTNGGQVPLLSPGTTNYTLTVGNTVSSITLTPVTSSPGATVTIDGAPVASGTASGPIALNSGANTIPVVVTASDGVTTKTYTVTVISTSADFAWLAYLTLNGGTVPVSPSFDFNTMSYTASVPNSTATVTATPLNFNASESTTVNGTPVANHTASNPIALAVGANTISVVVTAQDGVTTQTYTVTVTRATAPVDSYSAISVSNPANNPSIIAEDIKVHQGISPNGDGIDDVFTIDNIANYPQNNLMIMDRNGAVIYQAKGYDNVTKAFDGHSNINGRMQLPGTYFYALDYTVNGVNKRKTGFIVLKY